MRKLVKVCGMRDPENIQALIKLCPDMIGLIFYPESPRYVSNPAALVPILKNLKGLAIGGVFVNESYERILLLNEMLNFNFVQLHGSETPDFCQKLKAHKLKIIKAFGISTSDDLVQLSAYEDSVDFFLLDTKSPAHGGSGIKFNWDILETYSYSVPFLLSGGIAPGDFPQITHAKFCGVDLNSRFEDSPGLKNISLVSEYIKRFRK